MSDMWNDNAYDDDEEDTTPTPRDLRELVKKLQKENKKLADQVTQQHTSKLAEMIQSKGVKPKQAAKIAKEFPKDKAATDESIAAYLAEEWDIEVKEEAPVEESNSNGESKGGEGALEPETESAFKALQDVADSALTPADKGQNVKSKLEELGSGNSEEELWKYIDSLKLQFSHRQ